MPYVVVYTFTVLMAWLSRHAGGSRRPAGAAVMALLLALTAMRGQGMDYEGYVEIYELLRDFDLEYPLRLFLGKDALFTVMVDSILWLGAGPQVMFVCMAVLSIGIKQRAFSIAYRGDTATAWLATLCLTFFLHDYTQSRGAVAIAMCFMALLNILERRRTAWLLWMLGAIGFHVSTVIFVPISAALLVRREWRAAAVAAAALAIVAVVLLSFELLAANDPRLSEHTETLGASWTPMVISMIKLGALWLLAHRLTRPTVPTGPTDLTHGRWPPAPGDQLLWPSLYFYACGTLMLLAFQGRSAALAFRMYEFFEAFSVFIIASALTRRRAPAEWLVAVLYCLMGIGLQLLPKVLGMPYSLAPWSSYF